MKKRTMEMEFAKIYRTGAAAYLTDKELVSYYGEVIARSHKDEIGRKEAKEFVLSQLETMSSIDNRMAIAV